MVFLVLLATLLTAPLAAPALAQQPAPAMRSQAAGNSGNPATAQTPKSEEEEENGFLNSPMVARTAHLFGASEPTGRLIFLAINFAIIFLAIAIPLTRSMPRIFRRRSQTLRHSLELAKQASEEARRRLSAVEAKLAGLDQEIAGFRAQVEMEIAEDEKRFQTALQEESNRIVAAAELEIHAAATHARRGLRALAADLAVEHASRQIQVTAETDRELIGEFIGELAAGASQLTSDAGEPASVAAGGER